ncbi:MAG: hypothetical protein KA770_00260 [Shewanella sp.]|nr:hypothetical protein [Shewanella sp.]
MSSSDAVYYKYTNLSASAQIAVGQVRLGGIFCASSTSGTVKVWDSTAASGDICVNTFAVTAGTYYPIPALLKTGCYITIANTADITVMWL